MLQKRHDPAFPAIALFMIAFSPCGGVGAQVTIPQEYGKTVGVTSSPSALDESLFGDNVSAYTGATHFSVVDVSLPGNSELKVEVRRRYEVESRTVQERNQLLSRQGGFADWSLDLPRLEGVFAYGQGWRIGDEGSDLRCSHGLGAPPMAVGSPGGFWDPAEYWHGNQLHMPGQGSQELLAVVSNNSSMPTQGGPYPWVTNSLWYFSCVGQTANGVSGDAFVGHAPDGTRYRFDWVVARPVSPIIKSFRAGMDVLHTGAGTRAAPSNQISALSRDEVHILPTRVEDRFGNFVQYSYDNANPWRIVAITSSDGRSLSFNYNQTGRISSVSDGTRTWHYSYNEGLSEVLLPDQSRWIIDFASLRNAFTRPEINETRMCSQSGAASGQDNVSGTVTHPSGAIGVFTFRSLTHGRSYVPRSCLFPNPYDQTTNFDWRPYLFNSISIIQKLIDPRNGGSHIVWSYSYGTTNHSWLENCGTGCIDSKNVEISGPESSWMRLTYGNRYRVNEGLLLKTERGTSPASIMSTEITEYQLSSSGMAYPAKIGESVFTRGDFMSERLTPVRKRELHISGTNFLWQVDSTCGQGSSLCFDHFARPTKVISGSFDGQ